MGQSEGYGQSRDIGNIVHKTQNEDQTNTKQKSKQIKSKDSIKTRG